MSLPTRLRDLTPCHRSLLAVTYVTYFYQYEPLTCVLY